MLINIDVFDSRWFTRKNIAVQNSEKTRDLLFSQMLCFVYALKFNITVQTQVNKPHFRKYCDIKQRQGQLFINFILHN